MKRLWDEFELMKGMMSPEKIRACDHYFSCYNMLRQETSDLLRHPRFWKKRIKNNKKLMAFYFDELLRLLS